MKIIYFIFALVAMVLFFLWRHLIWLTAFADIKNINTISNIFTAIGTVGAVIVALWLAKRDNKPQLRVYAMIGVITPKMENFLWLSCTNVSKLPINCTDFAFNPNRFKRKGIRFTFTYKNVIQDLSTSFPRLLRYSDKADKCYRCFLDIKLLREFLSKHRWLAKLQLKWFWRVVAVTPIKEFEGKLSNDLIDKCMTIRFPEAKNKKEKQNRQIKINP